MPRTLRGVPWYQGMLSVLDLETTGVDTREDRIVTGYVATMLGRAEGRRQSVGADILINPGVPIPAGASAIHGITDAVAQEKGVDPWDGVNALVRAVADSLTAHIPVAGFNLAFDLAYLHWEAIRWGIPTVAERLGFSRDAMYGPIIDAHVLDKHVSHRRGSRKLDDSNGPGTATHYGVPLLAAHTADADAVAAVRVAVVIAERYPEIGGMSIVDLHKAQKGWRAEQMTSLERYFRTMKGQADAYCDPCWPYCVDETHPTAKKG